MMSTHNFSVLRPVQPHSLQEISTDIKKNCMNLDVRDFNDL